MTLIIFQWFHVFNEITLCPTVRIKNSIAMLGLKDKDLEGKNPESLKVLFRPVSMVGTTPHYHLN